MRFSLQRHVLVLQWNNDTKINMDAQVQLKVEVGKKVNKEIPLRI